MRIRYYWINLDSAKSRYNNMICEFEKNGITDHTRIPAYPSIGQTKRLKENACCRSHLQAVMHFLLNSNDPYALICEDDLTFELKQYWKKSVEEVVNEAPSDWGIIQLATILQRLEEKTGKMDTYFKWGDQRSSSCLAWVIHRKCAVDLLNTYLTQKNIYEFATPDCWSSGVYIRVDKNTKYTSYTYKYPMFIYPDENDSQLDNSLPLHVACKKEVIQFLKHHNKILPPTPPPSKNTKLSENKKKYEDAKVLTNIKKDGFGAQYIACITCYLFCRKHNIIYHHTDFTEIDHYNGKTEYCKHLNTLTGLVSDKAVYDSNEIETSRWLIPLTVEDFKPEYLNEIRSLYYSTPKPSPIVCDIAIHIRRGDVSEQKNHQRFINVSYYKNIIDDICSKHFTQSSPNIVIFSEGSIQDFELFSNMENVSLMLNTDICEAFHTMVTAPHFVMGYSALSCCAGILSTNNVYYTRSQTWVKQCIYRLKHWIDYTSIPIGGT